MHGFVTFDVSRRDVTSQVEFGLHLTKLFRAAGTDSRTQPVQRLDRRRRQRVWVDRCADARGSPNLWRARNHEWIWESVHVSHQRGAVSVATVFRERGHFGPHSFAAAGPSTWNTLPVRLRN